MKEQPDQNRTIGYARVSREDQNLRMQKAALEKHGCSIIYEEKNLEKIENDQPCENVQET